MIESRANKLRQLLARKNLERADDREGVSRRAEFTLMLLIEAR